MPSRTRWTGTATASTGEKRIERERERRKRQPRGAERDDSAGCAYLLVVEPRGEGEDAGLGVQREHVAAPVGDDRVGDDAVGALVLVAGRHLADARAARRVLAHLQRVRPLREHGRVVVGVRHLRAEQTAMRKDITKCVYRNVAGIAFLVISISFLCIDFYEG